MTYFAFHMHSIFLVLASLPLASAVAVVRRETDSDGAVALSSKGDMIEIATTKHQDTPSQFCRDSWPTGNEKANTCKDPEANTVAHTIIRQQAECREASKRAGLREVAETTFVIDRTWWMKRPIGCFAFKCDAPASDEMCYYFNESPLTPNDITGGTPICKGRQYEFGTSTANDVKNGCPTGYTPIMDEAKCRDAGNCLDRIPAAEFRTGVGDSFGCHIDPITKSNTCTGHDKEEHHKHPIGCYIDVITNRTHFNFVETGYEIPSAPAADTPICVVETPTSW